VPTVVNQAGELPARPGFRSTIRFVPAAVPLLRHSSWPVLPSSATNTTSAPNGSIASSTAPPNGLMSSTSVVPFAVPSVTHSSSPPTPSSAAK